MITFYSLFMIALALSLDAFGVALCIGLNGKVNLNNKMAFVFSFGFFQFLFSLLGAYGGFLFNTYIASVPSIIGGILIIAVGGMMVKEGYENKGECPLINPKMYVVLGVSVSIDAMVVGFTALSRINTTLILLQDTLFIGVITCIMTVIAFITARYLKRIEIVGKYADYIGGIILIIFGLKMILGS